MSIMDTMEDIKRLADELSDKPQKTTHPDWSEAPEWANYHAVDADGEECWYGCKPELGHISWLAQNERWEIIDPPIASSDWKDTLSQRPMSDDDHVDNSRCNAFIKEHAQHMNPPVLAQFIRDIEEIDKGMKTIYNGVNQEEVRNES